jgi:hypothetical protein
MKSRLPYSLPVITDFHYSMGITPENLHENLHKVEPNCISVL